MALNQSFLSRLLGFNNFFSCVVAMGFVLCSCQSVAAPSTRSCWATHHNCTLICKCDIVNRTWFRPRLRRDETEKLCPRQPKDMQLGREHRAAAANGADRAVRLRWQGSDRCVCVCVWEKLVAGYRTGFELAPEVTPLHVYHFLLPAFLFTSETASSMVGHINGGDGQTV